MIGLELLCNPLLLVYVNLSAGINSNWIGLVARIRYGSGFGILCTGKESNNCHFKKNRGVREVRTRQGVERMRAVVELNLPFCEGMVSLTEQGCTHLKGVKFIPLNVLVSSLLI